MYMYMYMYLYAKSWLKSHLKAGAGRGAVVLTHLSLGFLVFANTGSRKAPRRNEASERAPVMTVNKLRLEPKWIRMCSYGHVHFDVVTSVGP
jgi:hypothetical protein